MDMSNLESIADSSKVMVVALDENLRYVYVNDAHERVSGLTREQALGRTNAEIFGEEASKQWDEADRESLRSDRYIITANEWTDSTGKLRKFIGTRMRVVMDEEIYSIAMVSEISNDVPSLLEESAADLRGMIMQIMNMKQQLS